MELKNFLLPGIIFVITFITLYYFRHYFFKYLTKVAERTKWPWDEIIISSFRRYFFLWSLLLAIILILPFFTIPPSFLNIVNKTILILFIITFSITLSQILINTLKHYLSQKNKLLTQVTLFEISIKIIIYTIAIILVLNVLNINITPFITTLGVVGLVVGLALKDTLSNFFAGLNILMARQIKPGDFIQLESGEEGFVKDITWRTTTVHLLSDNLLIIPNSKLAESKIINYSLPEEFLNINVTLGVSYKSDLSKVERVTYEVAKELMVTHPEGVSDFEPIVRFRSFGDFSINFIVILRVKNPLGRFIITHEFIKRLQKRFQEEGIEIPFPIRTIYLYPQGKDASN